MTRPDRPRGPDTRNGPAVRPARPHHAESTAAERVSAATVAAPGGTGPDPWDAALSVIHSSVDSLGPWLAIWQARAEPDAHARRCAADALAGIDDALASLHAIRGWLVSSTRQADDATAARADALLDRLREEPP
jgi:hypothetical protein